MHALGKGVACFLFLLWMFTNSALAVASNLEGFSWLPLLTASLSKVQPDTHCPQNQINDLLVTKNSQKINSNIREVNWDLNCPTNKSHTEAKSTTDFDQQQITELLKKLSDLPIFQLDVNTINLTSALIKNSFSSKLSLQKSASKFFIKLNSELLSGKVTLNLQTKKLVADVNISLDKLPNYINLTELQNQYLTDELSVHYQSDLNIWQKGEFKVSWKGTVTDFSDSVELSLQGEVDLIKETITLLTFVFNAKQVSLPISEKQAWKTGYIKLKNNGTAVIDYADFRIESLPVHIRVGSSNLFTKVERGKSKRIRIDKQKLPPVFMQLAISGKETKLLVDWTLTLLNQKLLGKLYLDPKFIKLQALENSLNLNSLVKSVGKYVDALDLLEIDKGSLKFDLQAQYQRDNKTVVIDSQLFADEISGKNDNIIFDGVSFNSRLHYLIDAQNKISVIEDKQQLKISNLFVGVPVQAVQIDASIDAGNPVVKHFKARLLGGRLDFDDFRLSAPSQTILNIGGISLAEVVKYSVYPEIQSQAIIDGMLPLKLTETGPEVLDGAIFARPPGGYIKVPENTVIKAMGRGNPAFSFTMQLLSNFQFDTLQGKIGYTSDGESDLKIEIKGISPNVSGTQPINFNYSHSENILKLLKSLRFNDELVRDIKERY